MHDPKKMMLLTAAVAAFAIAPARAAGDFVALSPGGPANYWERVPVQFVFVGYSTVQVPPAGFLAELVPGGDPVVRSRGFYGIFEPLGVHYEYDYSVTYANAAWENAFFANLLRLAVKESSVDGRNRTLFQDLYNGQSARVTTITDNYFVDAPSVEKWLYQHPPAGIDPNRNTVFFINWYGRTDFRFHTYTKFGEPDPDTGYDFGRNRQSRKIIAWGGTPASDRETGFGVTSRVWFYDLSAGPESWSNNWNITDDDVDGDGIPDYRMPPTWEYFANGYHKLAQLPGDLGKVARYIAVNLLFTPSPLYPPYITPNQQPASINLDLNYYDMYPSLEASRRYETPELLVRNESILHRIKYTFDEETMPITKEVTRCYQDWLVDKLCYPKHPQYPGAANLFLFNSIHREDWRDGGGQYEAGFFNYITSDADAPAYLGFADDNWIDGTQSGTFNFLSPGVVALGYGLTTTQVHEYGHHIGMSHPHDGYDPATGVDYGPGGQFEFVWTGVEVNSMMSYIDLNWDFSQFDLDNANRFQATAYMKVANAIAADVLQSRNARDGKKDLRRADEEFATAQGAFSAHNYAAAFDHAKRGYEFVRAAAEEADVEVSASDHGWDLLPRSHDNDHAKRDYAYVDRLLGSRRNRQ